MIFQRLKNLDTYYKETTGDKIVLNDVKYYSIEDRERITNALLTVYDDNTISMVPACDCGHMKGGYLSGKICPKCSTTVREFQDKTDPLLWLHAIDDMPKFMSPHFWLMLRTVMGKKIDCMRWLSDTSYNPGTEIPDFLIAIKNTLPNFERSYPFLVDNIENILIFLQNYSTFKTPRKKEIIEGLLNLYRNSKDLIYSYWLPIVNKKLFIIENTSKGNYTNLGIADVIDTVLQFVKMVNDPKQTPNKKSNAMARTISDLSGIYQYYNKVYLSSKPGIFRKHIYGGRGHFTFRAVITSIPGPHKYDEVEVPWAIGVTAFRPHLLNILCNRYDMTFKVASNLLIYAVNNYDPIVDKALNELLRDSYTKGKIAIILHRNPSLHQGSAQRVFINKFKTDPMDYTISMSILITAAMNADFDGDELNCIILADNNMCDKAHTLDPAYSIPGRNSINEVSGLLNLPKPTIATITNYLYDKNDTNIDSLNIIASMRKIEVDADSIVT